MTADTSAHAVFLALAAGSAFNVERKRGTIMRADSWSRYRIRRVVAVAAAVTVGVLGLSTATGSAVARTQVDPNGVLKYATDLAGLGTDRALDPIKSRSITDFVQLNLIYDTLLHAQDDGSYKPGLAQSYKVEGDNVVTVTLRPNLKFSDGTPVDANAEKISIDRAIAANNNNFAPPQGGAVRRRNRPVNREVHAEVSDGWIVPRVARRS